MTFGEKIRNARKQNKMTQKQLADSIGAAHNSVSDWECNKNKPDPDTIELLCGVLKITPNYLLTTSDEEFSPTEKKIIKKYRFISEYSTDGTKMVDAVLDREYSIAGRLKALNQEIEKLKLDGSSESVHTPAMRIINYYYRLASAGPGQIVFDTPPTKRIEIPDIPEYRKVDYAIGVNGNSMEPVYHNGDTLLIEMAEEIEVGEIGIFLVDNESYVKKLGEGELISLNPQYNNIPLTENSKCMGKVIDKLR